MSAREHKAVAVVITYACDECGEEMQGIEWSGAILGDVPKYPHRCSNGHEAWLPRWYPTFDVRRTPGLFG